MTRLLERPRVAIAMIQTPPLPGSYRYQGERLSEIVDGVLAEAAVLVEAGFDGLQLQNMGDQPVKQGAGPETVAYLTRIAGELKRAFPKTGLSILVNWDGVASLAVADALEADFIRVEHTYVGAEVTTGGIVEGQCCAVTQFRRKIGSRIPIFADVYEPHAVPLGRKPIEEAAWDTIHEGQADGLFLSGKSADESIAMVSRVRTKVPDRPIFLGGGTTGENVYQLLQHYDGVCVATWIKDGDMGNPVDPVRASQFMAEVRRARDRAGEGTADR